MATAKARSPRLSRTWPRALLAALLIAGGCAWFYSDVIIGYAQAGTAYGAKNACSCRYLGGRDINSCKSDFVPGMEAVFLSDNEDERAVTAYVPLVSSNRAQFREGYGCVLEKWEG